MSKFINCFAMSLCVVAAGSLVSCSDDDDPKVTPVEPGSTTEFVFPEGVPAQVGDLKITTNANGRVSEIVEGSETYSFKYGTFSRAKEFNGMMLVRDAEYPDDNVDFYLQINEQGFIAYALQVYVNAEYSDDEWWFEYNSDGQMTSMKRSEGDNEVSRMTYVNGDITSVSITNDDHPKASVYVIEYTSADVKVAVANKGGIMEFDEVFGIDMDEMAPAYYAGLLGRATKNLPVKCYKDDPEDEYSSTFKWDLNANQLPVKLTITYQSGSWTSEDVLEYKW